MPNGSLVGAKNNITSSSKSGIWKLEEQYTAQKNNVWEYIVLGSLKLWLDARNPGASPTTQWNDVSGNNNHFTWSGTPTRNSNNGGTYNLVNGTGCYKIPVTALSSTCTIQYWIKTNDNQALWLSGTNLTDGSGNYYVGAYSSGNKFYNGSCGSPTFWINTTQYANIYDNITPSSTWRFIEFKNVDLTTWVNWKINMYGSFNFDAGELGMVLIYDKNLSAAESLQNYNALRSIYGL